jgi:ribosomal protein S12 methylthiotransferase
VGCFKYSPVEGAAANALPGAVPEAVKQERYERFMEAQAAISESRLAAKVGRTLEVLIDEVQGETAIGRSHADAPEIDGSVSVSGRGLKPGQRVQVKITHADTYDLYGVLA